VISLLIFAVLARKPSGQPSSQPNSRPSSVPSGDPTVQPTRVPSSQPFNPTIRRRSSQSTCLPTRQPLGEPFESTDFLSIGFTNNSTDYSAVLKPKQWSRCLQDCRLLFPLYNRLPNRRCSLPLNPQDCPLSNPPISRVHCRLGFLPHFQLVHPPVNQRPVIPSE
jgi:hypothetical protein